MHACIIETPITEREYLSVKHSESCGIKNRSPTTECFYIGNLHIQGLRNVIFKKQYITIEHQTVTEWSMSIFINLQSFLLGDNLHSYSPDDFNKEETIAKLEDTLSSNIKGYLRNDHHWRFAHIEYSKDFFISKSIMMHIMKTCDYLDSRRKMKFCTHPSGIEFFACLKSGQRTIAFRIYHKLTEKSHKGYFIPTEQLDEYNFFRIELILFRDSIGDRSRENGFPLGDLDCFANKYIEAKELKDMLNEVYGSTTYRKRKDAVSIIRQNVSSVNMQNKLISFLDKINRKSIRTVRDEYKNCGRLQIYNSYVARLNQLDINLVFLPYNCSFQEMPALSKQIFKEDIL